MDFMQKTGLVEDMRLFVGTLETIIIPLILIM